MYLVGPLPLRLLFHGFVVLVGTLILSGAVNTAIIGSNGVLNRVAEDGVLPDWFRHPHTKFGTTSRLINLIVILQIAHHRDQPRRHGDARRSLRVRRGLELRHEGALACWCCATSSPAHREWKVPLNFHIGKTEIPLGLMMITVALFALAIINVLTKKVATISGVTFTIVFFIVFELSEIYNRKRKAGARPGDGEIPPGHARRSLPRKPCTCAPATCWWPCAIPTACSTWSASCKRPTRARWTSWCSPCAASPRPARASMRLDAGPDFLRCRDRVFTKVVTLAEKAGKHVELMVVPGTDPYDAIVQTAARLQSSRIVMGLSPKLTPSRAGRAGGRVLGEAARAAALASRSNSCSRIRRTWCSSTWAPIRRASGPKISTWCTASGSSSAPAVRGRNCITAMSSVSPCAAWPPNCSPPRAAK